MAEKINSLEIIADCRLNHKNSQFAKDFPFHSAGYNQSVYCRTRFGSHSDNSDQLIIIFRLRHRNYTLYRSCLLMGGIAIVSWLPVRFLGEFEEYANSSLFY